MGEGCGGRRAIALGAGTWSVSGVWVVGRVLARASGPLTVCPHRFPRSGRVFRAFRQILGGNDVADGVRGSGRGQYLQLLLSTPARLLPSAPGSCDGGPAVARAAPGANHRLRLVLVQRPGAWSRLGWNEAGAEPKPLWAGLRWTEPETTCWSWSKAWSEGAGTESGWS